MKKTLKIKGCAHNPTFDNLQGWYKKSFEQLGWMVLAIQYNYTEQIAMYKKNTLLLRDCIAKKYKKIVDPDKKDELKSMLNNVEILIKHINKDFK
jgi:hypothetical protein